MSKILEQSDVEKCMEMSHAFESMHERELEHWRMAAELQMNRLGGVAALSHNPVHVKLVLQQSIAANLLNDKFGKEYKVADFGENGDVFMREPDEKFEVSKNRPLPSYAFAMEQEDDELSL